MLHLPFKKHLLVFFEMRIFSLHNLLIIIVLRLVEEDFMVAPEEDLVGVTEGVLEVVIVTELQNHGLLSPLLMTLSVIIVMILVTPNALVRSSCLEIRKAHQHMLLLHQTTLLPYPQKNMHAF